MKIKCPACQAVLNIPDSAAGKVVKCTCGKQLRAHGVAAKQPASPQSAKRPATAPQKPAATPSSGFDPGIFDELTDKDLQPVNVVGRAGRPAAATATPRGKLLQQYASGDVRDSGEGNVHGPRPGLLTFLGVVNVFWAIVYFGLALVFVGLVSFIPAIAEEIPDGGGLFLGLMIAAMVLMALISLFTSVACFVNKPAFWYFMLFSYSYGFGDRVLGVVGRVMNEEPGAQIGGAAVGVVIGLGFWVFMHSDAVRSYYGTGKASVPGVIVANLLGLILGVGLGTAVIFSV